MADNHSNFLQTLIKLSRLFDGGCEIGLQDDTLMIEGWDYLPIDEDTAVRNTIRRQYEVNIGYLDDEMKEPHGATVDELIEKIKADDKLLAEYYEVRDVKTQNKTNVQSDPRAGSR